PAARAVRRRPDPRPYERDSARRVRPVRRRGPDRTARPQSRHATIAAARVIAATTVTAATVTAATTVIAATVPAVWPRFTPVGSFPAPPAGRHQPLQGFVEPHHVLLARGGELPRHARHHHTGLEEQSPLQPQRTLVVQQLRPPAPDDGLRDEHGHDIAGRRAAQRLDELDDRTGDLAVRRLDDGERHGYVTLHPLRLEPPGVGLVDVDG